MALRSRHCHSTAGLASMDRPLLVSSVESQLCGFCSWFYRASWLAEGCSLASPICPTSVLKQRVPSGSLLPPPSWCLVGIFAMGSPCRVKFVSDLDQNEDSLRTFPSGWCLAFAMGSPVSGHVALICSLDWNEGFFRSSILRCFAMGSPCGSCVFFRTLDRNEACFG